MRKERELENYGNGAVATTVAVNYLPDENVTNSTQLTYDIGATQFALNLIEGQWQDKEGWMTEFLRRVIVNASANGINMYDLLPEADSRGDEVNLRRCRTGRIGAVVESLFEPTVSEIHKIVAQAAIDGKTEARKVWKIFKGDRQEPYVQPFEELLKYRELSGKVSEHFGALGLISEVIESGSEVVVPFQGVDRTTNHLNWLVGIRLSWAEPLAESN